MKNSLCSFTVWAGLLSAVVAGLSNFVGAALSTMPHSAHTGDLHTTNTSRAAPHSVAAQPVASAATASASTLVGPASSMQHPTSSSEHPAASIQHATGDRLLVESASRLARRRSVTARLRHQIIIHGEQLFGVGYYWQEGPGDDLKVRLE
jgi:hypothetical protein